MSFTTQFGVRPDSGSMLWKKIQQRVERTAKKRALCFPLHAREAKRELVWHRTVQRLRAQDRPRRILKEVARGHQVPVEEITGPRRDQWICRAREEACWRLYDETSIPLARIGERLGGRNHSTIDHELSNYMRRNGIAERPLHRRRER